MFVFNTIQEPIQPGPHIFVEALERALLRAGFNPGPFDGGFGPETTAAVKAFQAANGLAANGIVGPETWEALPDEDMQGLPGLQEGSTGGAVALLQRSLKQSGFDPGPATGVFGASTTAKVKEFQTAMRVIVDGVVGDQTWSCLS